MSESTANLNTTSSSFSSRVGPGHITLESLLDSPGLTPPSPLSESLNDPCNVENGTIQVKNLVRPSPVTQNAAEGTQSRVIPINEQQRIILLRDACVELLYILRSQDINGYFLSSLPAMGVAKGQNRVGLLDIEKRVFSNSYSCFSDFQNDVITLFSGALAYHTDGTQIHGEAQRLFTLASDWFASISPDQLQLLNMRPRKVPGDDAVPTAPADGIGTGPTGIPPPLAPETYLAILNPDNNGIVSRTERVRSIGDEVRPLRIGSHLLPNGGYREDRRNKVIPYTYLDYGPYYSFAPRYDSGASHCSPEANQLILSTSWLPARTAFLQLNRKSSDFTEDPSDKCDADEITRAIQSEVVSAALESGDNQLAVSLAVVELENQATARLATELDRILPGPEVDDDCVFGLCLANALTGDLSMSDDVSEPVVQSESEKTETIDTPNREDTCDLDQTELTSAPIDDESVELRTVQTELMNSANDLRALYCAQYRRLGDTTQTASMNGATLHPSPSETAIAHRLMGRLVDLTKRAKPRDLVHPYALRRAMGMQPHLYALPDDLVTETHEPEPSVER